MNRIALGLALACLPLAAPAAPPAAEIRAMAEAHSAAALALYREFLALPNDANHPADILRLVDWMEDAFADRGFEVRRLPTAGSPQLFAERRHPGAQGTVLVYLQSDGQPVDPSAWDQPDPYAATLKAPDGDHWRTLPWSRLDGTGDPDWRIFARSAADSKGPMTQFLTAIDALDAAAIVPAFDLKVIIDTEEELGSPRLPALVAAHRERLSADLLLIFDGPPHASGKPTVAFGARGIMTATLTSWGPRRPQHSGHYGNWVPNPAFSLARLLASMKDANGRVLVDGWYDGIDIDEATRARLADVPDDEAELQQALGYASPDAVAGTLQEALQYPSLNLRGLRSAWVGNEARTIIPATAVAELDIRLVAESDPDRLLGLLRRHIGSQGYVLLEGPPDAAARARHRDLVTLQHEFSYAAFRSDFDAAAGRLARAGMRHLYGHEPILIRTMGGSIPISPFVETLGIPAASVPTVNIDNNQHSPNENIRLGDFIEGISILISVLSQRLD